MVQNRITPWVEVKTYEMFKNRTQDCHPASGHTEPGLLGLRDEILRIVLLESTQRRDVIF
jgi:hypothetical protein